MAVNQEHWQLEALFLVQSSPLVEFHGLPDVSIEQLWPLSGSEASIQPLSTEGQGRQQHDSTRTRALPPIPSIAVTKATSVQYHFRLQKCGMVESVRDDDNEEGEGDEEKGREEAVGYF